MNLDNEKQLREIFVKGIKEGLSEAAIDAHNRDGQFYNARNFEKMDSIMNGITKELDRNQVAQWCKLNRGSYQVLLVFDSDNKHLYSFMSEKRFREICSRVDENIHYIHGLVKYNEGYERQQLVIEHPMLIESNEKLQSLLEQVEVVLGHNKPEKYYTIIFEMNGYELLGVKSTLTSEYMEIIVEENWSELISIDYGDINYSYNDYDMTTSVSDLGITLKTKFIGDDDDIESTITPKEEIKISENE